MADLANARMDFTPREHGLLDIARDRQRRRALAVDRAVDRIGKAVVGVDRPLDLVEPRGNLPDDVTNPVDILGDVARGAARLAGERLHFGGDHGDAATGLARARGLDPGVERQQIGPARPFAYDRTASGGETIC